jgi:hypothetical protein
VLGAEKGREYAERTLGERRREAAPV